MPEIPAAGYFSNLSLVKGDYKTGFEDLVASLRHVPWSGQIEVAQTITSGSITPPGSAAVLVLDTESAAPVDDLTNIVTTNYPDGAFLLLRNANASRSVTIKHAVIGSGTIELDRGVDYVLDDTRKWLLIRRHDANWYELMRGPQRMTTEIHVRSATFAIEKQHIGTTFVCTGTYTASLPAAAAAGAGFVVTIRNEGVGTLTLDPNGAELVNGASTMAITPGWSFQFVCTGTGWHTVSSAGPQIIRNPLHNGLMEVWQRGTAVPVSITSTNSGIGADRWIYGRSFASTTTFSVTVNRSTSVPSVTEAGMVLNYSMETDITTAVPSPTSDDVCYLYQTIFDSRQLNQRAMVLSFWVYSAKTGVHSVHVKGTSLIYYFTQTYTVNTANTWEFKTITIPPSSAWTGSMDVAFVLAAGSNITTTTLGSWYLQYSGPTVRAGAGQVNLFDSASNVFRLTAVRLDYGTSVSAWQGTSFADEYLRCLMHYQKSFLYATTPAQNVGASTGEYVFRSGGGAGLTVASPLVRFQVPLYPANVLMTMLNPQAANAQARDQTTGTDCSATVGASIFDRQQFRVQTTMPGGGAAGDKLAVHWTAATQY